MEKYEIVPVPTRILTHHDNICDAILEFGRDKIGPNDVVCAAESVVAITQGRAMRCEEFQPGFLAKTLSHLFPSKGSISSWVLRASPYFLLFALWSTQYIFVIMKHVRRKDSTR